MIDRLELTAEIAELLEELGYEKYVDALDRVYREVVANAGS